MPAPALTDYPPEYLDEFAAWCHADTPGVEISREKPAGLDAPHGSNFEIEMAV